MGFTGFKMSKWYADCVADDGEVIIAYVAMLSWRGLHLKYASLLNTGVSGSSKSQATVMRVAHPVVSPSEFSWRSAAFDFHGTWAARQSPITKTIYESPSGAIRWNCLQPLSYPQLVLKGRTVTGNGYVEHLQITLPPWKMPIDQLNWGRFLTDQHSVIWIDWKGQHSVRHVWLDGEPKEASMLNEHQLQFDPACSLLLLHDGILRDGAIGETVLHVLPKSFGPLPGRVLGIRETKWRSRGELNMSGQPTARGWAIHEVVQWPK